MSTNPVSLSQLQWAGARNQKPAEQPCQAVVKLHRKIKYAYINKVATRRPIPKWFPVREWWPLNERNGFCDCWRRLFMLYFYCTHSISVFLPGFYSFALSVSVYVCIGHAIYLLLATTNYLNRCTKAEDARFAISFLDYGKVINFLYFIF